MNRFFAAFATLLLLSGCATYGDGYYRDRVVYADGDYYYPAYEGEGDYYYGADTGYDFNYTYAYPYGLSAGWGLDRYYCRSYYGCAPGWGSYYPYYYGPRWGVSIGHSWGWGSWGWYGGHYWGGRDRWYHDHRDRTDTRPTTDKRQVLRENRYPGRSADVPDVSRRYQERERYLRRPSLGESGRRVPDPIRDERSEERNRDDTPGSRLRPESARRMPATGLGRPAPRDLEGRLGRPVVRDQEPSLERPNRVSLPVRPAPANARGPQMRYPVRQPAAGPRNAPRPVQAPRPMQTPRPMQAPRPVQAPRPAPRAAPRAAPRSAPQVRPASQNRTSEIED